MGKKADDFAWFDRDSNSLFFNFEPHYTELTDSNCNVFCTSISEYFQSKISGRDTFYGLKKTIENESGMIGISAHPEAEKPEEQHHKTNTTRTLIVFARTALAAL